MGRRKPYLTRSDAVIAVAALLVAVLMWAAFYLVPRRDGSLVAVIRVDGKEVARLPVGGSQVQTREVQLKGGIATVEYGQGKVRIRPPSEPFCPDGICWKTGWISRSGQSIVCVPNHMTITLEGSGSGVDTVVR